MTPSLKLQSPDSVHRSLAASKPKAMSPRPRGPGSLVEQSWESSCGEQILWPACLDWHLGPEGQPAASSLPLPTQTREHVLFPAEQTPRGRRCGQELWPAPGVLLQACPSAGLPLCRFALLRCPHCPHKYHAAAVFYGLFIYFYFQETVY